MIRFDGITIDRERRSIRYGGATCVLAPIPFRLACALILAGPIGPLELFDLVYGDRKDGGPLYGMAILKVMTSQLRPKLAAIGIDIYSEPWGWKGQQRRHWAAPRDLAQTYMEAAE